MYSEQHATIGQILKVIELISMGNITTVTFRIRASLLILLQF